MFMKAIGLNFKKNNYLKIYIIPQFKKVEI